MPDYILNAKRITFSYDENHTLIDEINLGLQEGSSTAILGSSGVGKTTLLEIVGLMREPDSGLINLAGTSVYDRGIGERAQIRGHRIGFIFQEGLLLPDLTVWENCRLAVELSPSNWSKEKSKSRYKELMEKLDLDPGRRDARPAELSTGQRQRVAVVRSMMHIPSLLIADEPTGNLDSDTSQKLIDLLVPLTENEKTALLIATHDMDLAQALDTIYYMKNGTLISKK